MSDLSSCHWCLEREKDLWLLREIDGNQDEIRTCCSASFLNFLREPEPERNHRFLELIRTILSLLISL